MVPSRYLARAKPLRVKRTVAAVKHISAPLKGLSLSSKLTTGDPLTATVLDNFVVEENLIRCRPGTRLTRTLADATPVEMLVPYYGQPNKLAAANAGKLTLLDGTVIKTGFNGNDWSWTSFSNLSATDYTVMVNGVDGVWSWNGGANGEPAVVPVTVLDNLNPVRVTVPPEHIGKFENGVTVTIAGGVGEWAFVNGSHVVGNVGGPGPNSFELVGVDGTVASLPQVGGVTAAVPGSMVKEAVTAPAGEAWVVTDQFNIVLSHMNRLFFADSTNLAVYYLPVQQQSGAVKVLPLNGVFKRGGSIAAMYTWTTEGGINLNDQLCVFSTNGECVIYQGVDPDSDWQLSGIFRFDAPMSKHSVINYGGELYVLISTGLVPMSTLMRAESEQLGQSEKNVVSEFFLTSLGRRTQPGWQAFINPSSGRVYCNMPLGGVNQYRQMVRNMPNPVWATWSGVPSRCWGWVNARVFFGTDDGKVYEMHPSYLNDDGKPIRIDVQAAWGNFGTPAIKQFKMLLPYIQSDGVPRPYIDIKVDYDLTPPTNQPDVTLADDSGAAWDTATWDESSWTSNVAKHTNWSGVGVLGHVGAPRLVALISNCEFVITGWDVLYETGSIFG